MQSFITDSVSGINNRGEKHVVLSKRIDNVIIISTLGFDERPVLRTLSET